MFALLWYTGICCGQGYAFLHKMLDEASFCTRAAFAIILQHLYLLFVSARYFVEGILETNEYTKRNIEQRELHTPIKHSGTQENELQKCRRSATHPIEYHKRSDLKFLREI